MQKNSHIIWIGLGAASAALVLCGRNLSASAIAHAAMLVLLAYAAAYDARERIIPNRVVAALAALRLAELGVLASSDACGALEACSASLIGAISVLAILLVTAYLMEHVVGSAGIGGGDVKLLSVLGFCFGWEAGLLITGLSCVLMLAHRLIPRLGKSTAGAFAFAPYIALATVLIVFLQGR